MLNLSKMAEELEDKTKWQATPYPLSFEQYLKMIIGGLERLFIDTGRALEYDPEKYIKEEDSYFYDADFQIDEKWYIMLCSQLEFFRKVQTDVNNTVSYTTDAISVTNADKPYANLKNTVQELDDERRIIYYKMSRYALGEG